jgi:hypothetical protein
MGLPGPGGNGIFVKIAGGLIPPWDGDRVTVRRSRGAAFKNINRKSVLAL